MSLDSEFVQRFVADAVENAQKAQQVSMQDGPKLSAEVTAAELVALDLVREGKLLLVQTELLTAALQHLAASFVQAGEVPDWFKQITGVDDGKA